MMRRLALVLAALSIGWASPALAGELNYGWQKVDGLNLFYREGGRAGAPTIVFLHGNPLSSIMYDDVMRKLLDKQDVHVLAVDYPSLVIPMLPTARPIATPSKMSRRPFGIS